MGYFGVTTQKAVPREASPFLIHRRGDSSPNFDHCLCHWAFAVMIWESFWWLCVPREACPFSRAERANTWPNSTYYCQPQKYNVFGKVFYMRSFRLFFCSWRILLLLASSRFLFLVLFPMSQVSSYNTSFSCMPKFQYGPGS